jgi:two-component system cell cycle response regulator
MSEGPETSKVLLVDDDPLQHQLTRAAFRRFSDALCELDCVATWDEGLERLLRGDYMACLLDFRLGERDGLELLRTAIKRGCRTPIIFLTAESGAGVDIAAMEAGALDYLVKGEMTPRMLERSLRYAVKLGGTLEELRRMATRDGLTGLLNRREFDRILAEEIERARRFGHPMGLVILDVDHFKQVNDRHGHPAGDAVLREVARRLDGLARTVDRLTRLGGEEFALILIESDGTAALGAAERLCAAVRAKEVDAGQKSLPITISAGSASFPRDADSAEALLAAADKALYAAKTGGRNRAVAAVR